MNLLFDDEPIENNTDDELGYNKYAELIAHKIENSSFKKAFAIGINAPWGMGKTSFINLVTKSLKLDNSIVINFNPWDCQSPEAIIQDFFSSLQEAMRPYHSSLSRRLTSYSSRLVKFNDSTLSNSINVAVASVTGVDSVDKIHNDINDALKEINKRLIITIDDIDRLNSNEVLEVLRLVRNTANFHNTIFLVAYDRNYVINALKNVKTHKANSFLEKIFQIEVTLPQFEKNVLLSKFESLIIQHIPETYHEEIHESLWGKSVFKPSAFNDFLINMRDVTRLANSVVLNLTKLQGEIVFDDFLRLEVLRLKYPVAYEMLFRNTNEVLATSATSEDNYYHLKKGPVATDGSSKYVIEELLTKKCHETGISDCEVEHAINILLSVFKEPINKYSSRKFSHLSVINPSAFKRYFNYELLKGDLSEIDFSIARQKPFDEFIQKINEWVVESKHELVRQRLVDTEEFDNRTDFEQIVKAIFYFARKTILDGKREVALSFRPDALIPKFKTGETLYESTTDLKAFVTSLFQSASPPYFFEAELIHYLTDEWNNILPFSREELHAFAIDYFRKYLSTLDKFESSIWHLYHTTKTTDHVEVGANTSQKKENPSKEANDLLKEFASNKDLDGFLFQIVHPETFDQKTFTVSTVMLEIFGEWKLFKEFLYEQDENKWKSLAEFKRFFAVFEENNFKKKVSFDFKTIDIKKKLRERYGEDD